MRGILEPSSSKSRASQAMCGVGVVLTCGRRGCSGSHPDEDADVMNGDAEQETNTTRRHSHAAAVLDRNTNKSLAGIPLGPENTEYKYVQNASPHSDPFDSACPQLRPVIGYGSDRQLAGGQAAAPFGPFIPFCPFWADLCYFAKLCYKASWQYKPSGQHNGCPALLPPSQACLPAMSSDYRELRSRESETFDVDDSAVALYRPHFLFPRRYSRLYVSARSLRRIVYVLFLFLVAVITLTFLFFPSYTHRPAHYRSLERSIARSQQPGRGNPRHEKVFIATSLYDKGGQLAGGRWGQNLLELIDLLGYENTFVSIYENDAEDEAERALAELDAQISCNKSVVFEPHYDFSHSENVTLPDGSVRLRRVPYLADLRNRALEPLVAQNRQGVEFDRILILNDVYFDPVDAVQLLFSTNADEDGLSNYRAACAVDFGKLIKFYDSFAVRDAHGYPIGVPFYPWFAPAGAATSRRDVLDQKDAVRVRGCWGGIVAFDAKYFQASNQAHTKTFSRETLTDRRRQQQPQTQPAEPVRFRAISDTFWEASESCLIHADLQEPYTDIDEVVDTGIYINPYIRVSYEYRAFTWLGVVRRFERLFAWPNWIANVMSGHPAHNSRRTDVAGQTVKQRVWQPDANYTEGGFWKDETRVASPGEFCARRDLFVLIPVTDRENPGDEGWRPVKVPPDPDSRDWIQ
ncbi:Genome polyprotein [Talaromyces islandicus]|uniref:Genome polyprotein n=1 Tax=Talaromyces islandicus TaxID=28573 RepID=A0A0U1M4W0_TALIS|nr:Genome polyprotein [Talaromyces islandicus]